MIINKICLIILQLHSCICVRKYDNYTLFRAIPLDENQLNYFQNISSIFDVQFWQAPGVENAPVDFVIPPEEKELFQLDATRMGIYLTTLISDVQRAFDLQTVKTYIRRRIDSFNWESYYRLTDIYSWMRDLRSQYPDEMRVYRIGKTHENRDILAVRIILKGCKLRSKVIVEGGIHAREWISPAFVTYMINQIIHAPYSEDDVLKSIALTYQWYFVPVVNPDGYEYTHKEDFVKKTYLDYFGYPLLTNTKLWMPGLCFEPLRLCANKKIPTFKYKAPMIWRESSNHHGVTLRKSNLQSICTYLLACCWLQKHANQDRLWRKNRHEFGVDLNRNFDSAFGSVGVSRQKSSDIYCGPAPFSEKESAAMATFIRQHTNELEYYFAFHSYGQHMIIPYAHMKEHRGNFYEVKEMGLNAATAIRKRYNTDYSVGTAYDTVGYRTSGVSGCWVKSKFNVAYVITFELRDKGSEGFALMPKRILPTCMETMDGLLSILSPRTSKFKKLMKYGDAKFGGGQGHKTCETVVLLVNFLMFVIVRFD